MNVRTLFFASYRDVAGTNTLEVDLPEGAVVTDLVQKLRASSDALQALPASPVVAVNMVYSPLTRSLSDGDEVAFIPPVSGG